MNQNEEMANGHGGKARLWRLRPINIYIIPVPWKILSVDRP